MPYQSPSAVLIALIWIAITKDEGKDGLKEVHALPTFLPESASSHVIRVQIPEDIQGAEPDSGASIAIAPTPTNREARVVTTPADYTHKPSQKLLMSC